MAKRQPKNGAKSCEKVSKACTPGLRAARANKRGTWKVSRFSHILFFSLSPRTDIHQKATRQRITSLRDSSSLGERWPSSDSPQTPGTVDSHNENSSRVNGRFSETVSCLRESRDHKVPSIRWAGPRLANRGRGSNPHSRLILATSQ